MSDEAKTVSSETSLHLYNEQVRDVDNMRHSLLSFKRANPGRANTISYAPAPVEYDDSQYFSKSDFPGEVWVSLPFWYQNSIRYTLLDGYQVSNLGRMKRLAHTDHYIRNGSTISANISERLLKRYDDVFGYYVMSLTACEPVHRGILVQLSRLVYYAFNAGAESTCENEIDHLNRCRHDNRLVNLELVDHCTNVKRSRGNGKGGFFIEFPDIEFDNMLAASNAIGRDDSYLWVCLTEGHPIRPKHFPQMVLHWQSVERG